MHQQEFLIGVDKCETFKLAEYVPELHRVFF